MTWVDDQIFVAGGTHIPATWAEFTDLTGIRAVFHIGVDRPALFRGPAAESFLWMNVSKESDAGMEHRLLAGRYIHTVVSSGQKVLLHSCMGRHRTRWAYVSFCLYRGRKLKTVLKEVAERPWLSPYHTDEADWETYIALLAKTSGS